VAASVPVGVGAGASSASQIASHPTARGKRREARLRRRFAATEKPGVKVVRESITESQGHQTDRAEITVSGAARKEAPGLEADSAEGNPAAETVRPEGRHRLLVIGAIGAVLYFSGLLKHVPGQMRSRKGPFEMYFRKRVQ